MDALFLMLAVILALAALVVAVLADLRTRRATRALARELVQLRDYIRTHADPAVGPVTHSGGETAAHELAQVMGPRIERLERRLAEALETPLVGPSSPVRAPDTEQQILVALRRQGYGGAVILESLANGSVRIEAEREGMTIKGVATIDDDGVLDVAAVSSARAFP